MILDDLGWRLMDRGWTFRMAERCVAHVQFHMDTGYHLHWALRLAITELKGQCDRGKPHDDLVAIAREDVAGWPRQRRRSK